MGDGFVYWCAGCEKEIGGIAFAGDVRGDRSNLDTFSDMLAESGCEPDTGERGDTT